MYVRPIGANVAGYYLHQGAGRWVGSAPADLGLEGSVGRSDLQAALRGCDPASGRFLPRSRAPRRRAGWDLVFAAPKSLSLLAAAPGRVGEQIGAAQRDAVGEALSHFESSLLYVRRSNSPSGRAPVSGAVAAEFDHSKNAGGEPHLHSHLLLINLGKDPDGRWSPIGGWWLERRQLDAVYALGLRHHLRARGIEVEWRVRPDGLVDVAGVPRAALRATSTRTHEAMTGARHTGRLSDTNRPWRERARAEGWEPTGAIVNHSNQSGPAPRLQERDLGGVLAARLALAGSTFGRRDVLLALGACPDAGFTSEGVRRWVDEFLSRCERSTPARGPADTDRSARWTSELARSADRRLERSLRDLTLDGPGVTVLGCAARESQFLSHAEVAAECLRLGEPEGMQVVVSARSRLDALRWKTLTGIEEMRPSSRPDVVFIDQADRRPSAELSVILGAAAGARIVLVEGGTSLRRAHPASVVLEDLSNVLPRRARAAGTKWDVGGADGTHPAVAALQQWAERRTDSPAVLVGLGVPETQALNEAARRHLSGLGELTGPELLVSGRGFRRGDTVIAVRPLGPGLPAGTMGTIAAVDVARATAVIEWPNHVSSLDRPALARIGHGYAATPRLASRSDMPALVLGPSEGIGLERHRVLAAFSASRAQGPMRALEGRRPYGPDTWPVHW